MSELEEAIKRLRNLTDYQGKLILDQSGVRVERDELAAIMRVLRNENRLKCVVDGRTTNDGKPAPLCPDICSGAQMCAGCRARVWCEQNGTTQ